MPINSTIKIGAVTDNEKKKLSKNTDISFEPQQKIK